MKLLKKTVCALLTICLLNVSVCTPVFAAEVNSAVPKLEALVTAIDTQPGSYAASRSTTFIDTTIDMAYSAEGMRVEIHTDMNMTASVVGVKDIKIQKKGFWGWTTVATSTGGEAYNVGGCVVTLTYTGIEYGEIYRVTCTHYGNVDEYRELYHETEGFTCIY